MRNGSSSAHTRKQAKQATQADNTSNHKQVLTYTHVIHSHVAQAIFDCVFFTTIY